MEIIALYGPYLIGLAVIFGLYMTWCHHSNKPAQYHRLMRIDLRRVRS